MNSRPRTIPSGSFYAVLLVPGVLPITVTVNHSGMRQRRTYNHIAEQQRVLGRLIRYDRFGDASANCIRLLRQALDLGGGAFHDRVERVAQG
jgi:hypothetical protein